MHKGRIILVLGVLIALLPLLGFPRSWEAFFQIVAGFSIVLLSVWATIDRKLKLHAKAQQRATRKSVSAPPESAEANPDFGKRVTDFYPKTAPPGRRLSDINPTTIKDEPDL